MSCWESSQPAQLGLSIHLLWGDGGTFTIDLNNLPRGSLFGAAVTRSANARYEDEVYGR